MIGTSAPSADADRHWMEQALALAALGEGATSPNPRVGCVLVRDGALVGSGFHQAPGAAHAEQLALERAGARARGATAYVNLEPCAHQGRTPPCAARLVEAGTDVFAESLSYFPDAAEDERDAVLERVRVEAAADAVLGHPRGSCRPRRPSNTVTVS